jgi:hypothetical protein
MNETFLSHPPQQAFADRIGAFRIRWCFENLNRTFFRYTSEDTLYPS